MQQRPQSAHCLALAANELSHIVLGNSNLDQNRRAAFLDLTHVYRLDIVYQLPDNHLNGVAQFEFPPIANA
jgi:hypothetical protein